MSAAAIQNRYIPLNVEGVRKRRRREEDGDQIALKDHWKNFKIACSGSFPAAIGALEFSSRSHGGSVYFVIAGSTRVDFSQLSASLVSGTGQRQRREIVGTKSYSRFKNFVRCISVRSDGKLTAAGDETGLVQVFDSSTRTQLRRLFGHNGPVRSCCFAENKSEYLLTGGADASLRLWDVSDGSCYLEIKDAHTDSIKCIVAGLSQQPNILTFVSGGYDGYIKLWALNIEEKIWTCLHTFDHGYPVESVVFFPSGNSLLISGGGPEIKIWDMSGGGILLHSLKSHMKIVTCVGVATDGSYIMSGSLDQTVKFYCPSTFALLHSFTYDEPVTSITMTKDCEGAELIGVGLIDGQWIIRQRVKEHLHQRHSITQSQPECRVGTTRFFKRGKEVMPKSDDIVIETVTSKRCSWLDKLIQGFNFQRSLECAIKKGATSAIALIEALVEQGALHIAVRGKDETSILPMLSFVYREFGQNINSTSLLLEFTHILLEENPWLYTTTNELVLQGLQKLSGKLDMDISQHQILRELSGIIELIGAAHVA